MEFREYRTTDKSEWGQGPWNNEPDTRQWQDPVTGLPCLIVRSHATGSLCGYVGVPPWHPAFGMHYHPRESAAAVGKAVEAIVCHGGLTFSSLCQPFADESAGICHVPDPGEPADVWWFGFDCGHYLDHSPALMAVLKRLPNRRSTAQLFSGEEYRDIDYVTSQCLLLALQLKEIDAVYGSRRLPPLP